jgi:hypothetical protein
MKERQRELIKKYSHSLLKASKEKDLELNTQRKIRSHITFIKQ